MERVLLPTERRKQHPDDLKQIRGIGPAVEQRLNQAGILTFTQLASMAAENLANLFSDMPGLSAARIAEKDWINQARLLMEKETAIDDPPPDGQYSAVFSIDLLLDNQSRVRRTHILHVQSRREDSWADWNKERLAGFLLENATIRSAQKTLQEYQKQAKATEIAGDLSIAEMEIQAESGKVSHWDATVNEPFAIRLELDMEKTSVSIGTPLQYGSEIYAKNLMDGKRQKIGESKGRLESKKLIPLVVNCGALPEGSYRLEACVILSPDLGSTNPRSCLMAMTEGRVFRVT